MKKIMIFGAALLLMSSCGLYNKYERPDNVQTQGLIRDIVSDGDTLAVAPEDTASFGNLPWRSVFTDPQLQALIEQGLQKNANLQNAVLSVQMYETMLKAAKLAFLPAIQEVSLHSIPTPRSLPRAILFPFLPVGHSTSLAISFRRSVLPRCNSWA